MASRPPLDPPPEPSRLVAGYYPFYASYTPDADSLPVILPNSVDDKGYREMESLLRLMLRMEEQKSDDPEEHTASASPL